MTDYAPLWPTQDRTLKFIESIPVSYALINSGMSTGKTRVGLEYLKNFTGPRLVLCPKPVIPAWIEDNERPIFNLGLPLLTLTEGSSRDKGRAMLDAAKGPGFVCVVNYETAYRLPLEEVKWSAVVADEVHTLGSWSGITSRTLAIKLNHVPYKIGLTGTPFSDGYAKLYGITRFFDAILPESKRGYPQSRMFGHWNAFLDRYANTYNKGHIRIIKGYKNTEELVQRLSSFTLTLSTDEVARENGVHYPHIIERSMYADLTGPLAKAYKEMEEDAVVTLAGLDLEDNLNPLLDSVLAPHQLTQILRLQQLADSGVLVPEAGAEPIILDGLKEREAQLSEWLDVEVGNNEPVVIFTRFKHDEVIVARIAKRLGEDVAYLTGTEDNHLEWRAGKYRILIVNIAAGSEGVRLERARFAAFWSTGFSASDFEQAIARLRRIGSLHDTVSVRFILSRVDSRETIDGKIYRALQRKIAQKNYIVRRLREEQAQVGAPRRL